MTKKTKFYLVKEKAVPEVLLKVVEAKRILDAEKMTTVQEATERVGISRSSFYKYKDDIQPFSSLKVEDGYPNKIIGFIRNYEKSIKSKSYY